MATMRGEIPHDDRTDDQLVAATLAGDPQAFGVLVGRHDRYVHGAARRFAGINGAVDADDVAQETFARAYTMLHTYIPQGRFKHWLGMIAANYAKDMLRRRRFVAAGDPEWLPARLLPTVPGPEAAALTREAEDEWADRLLATGKTCGAAMALVYGAGLSYQEAEVALGIPGTTLKMRLYRGRQRLREQLAAV